MLLLGVMDTEGQGLNEVVRRSRMTDFGQEVSLEGVPSWAWVGEPTANRNAREERNI